MNPLRAAAVWSVILLFAVGNGILREAVLMPRFTVSAAYLISGLLLSLIILGVAIGFAPWLRLGQPNRSLATGLLWLALTLIFEFAFGGWIQGRSWEELLEAYTFKDGNIWPLVLLVTLMAPAIAHSIRYRR